MSAAGAQHARFKEQAVREGCVFTFKNGDFHLVFPVAGRDVWPFWSSRSRLVRIQRGHSKYREFEIVDIELSRFMDWLPKMGKDGILIGVNWSGKRLTGSDVEPMDLHAGVQYWIRKLKS